MFKSEAPREVTAFAASGEARQVVGEICEAIALPQNFKVYSVNNPTVNAYADYVDGERLIVYDESFMKRVANKQSRDWSGLTIMAHEIGHHLSGHTLDGLGSRPPRELEADHFAGYVVRVLGGNLARTVKIFEDLSEEGSSTHPPRSERTAAVTVGWKKADAKSRSVEERHNLITHNLVNGKLASVISEFVGSDKYWAEYQDGKVAASFREQARDGRSIFLYDGGRSMWLKIDGDDRGGLALGSWARGSLSQRPTLWTPLDPVKWK